MHTSQRTHFALPAQEADLSLAKVGHFDGIGDVSYVTITSFFDPIPQKTLAMSTKTNDCMVTWHTQGGHNKKK